MKKISLLLAFVALFITASFASDSLNKTKFSGLKKNALVKSSCTVTVKSGKYDVTTTITCDCTRREACDVAYKVSGALL